MNKPSIKQLVLGYAKEYGSITHALMGGHEQKRFNGYYMGTDESIGKRCRELFKDRLMMRGKDKDGYSVYWPKEYDKPSKVKTIDIEDHRYIYGDPLDEANIEHPEVKFEISSGGSMVAGTTAQRLFDPPKQISLPH